jgi:hypothetical protein
MLGIFKTPPYHDEVLGDLKRSGRHWKGSLPLSPHGTVELIVSGNRSSPDSHSLALARDLPERYEALRPVIQASLFEHYEPGREAAEEGAFPQHVKPFPKIANSEARSLTRWNGTKSTHLESGYKSGVSLSCVAACDSR